MSYYQQASSGWEDGMVGSVSFYEGNDFTLEYSLFAENSVHNGFDIPVDSRVVPVSESPDHPYSTHAL
jgi:hypothetical protein